LPLVGEGVTQGIVRIGDTVRRPVRPFTATVQTYLRHLRASGFHDAPEPLGYDEQGREVLTFVDGDVPTEPFPEATGDEQVLVALARLVRRLDDAADGWVPPDDAVWGGVPGAQAPGVVPLFAEPELVGHRDFCPGNVVFRDGLPAAMIDFDLAAPTTRLYEVANALYWWAPFADPSDRAAELVDADVPRRTRAFVDAYGLSAEQRHALVPFAARMIANFHRTARRSAELDPTFARLWDSGVRDRMPRTEIWFAEESAVLAEALL
jgi:hypothetical protein